MIKYKNNINVGTGSVGYEADATSAAPLDSVSGGKVVKSEGRTVKWNQMFDTITKETTTTNWGSYKIENGVVTLTHGDINSNTYVNFLPNGNISFISGHKYYINGSVGGTTASSGTHRIWVQSNSAFPSGHRLFSYDGGLIMDALADESIGTNQIYVQILTGNTPGTYVFTPQLIDLTFIFGSGNEPATVEAFESWLAENMVEQDYYAYDAGSLVPVTVKGVKRDVGGTTVTNPMPVTTLKDENDVVMFPDGLKSAGSVKDEIDWEHGVAVKRVGVVDLGDLEYSREFHLESFYRFRTTNFAKQYGSGFCASLDAGRIDALNDKQFGIGRSVFAIRYDDYTDASAFKTAMQGVLLYYELATPITYHFATHADLKKRVVKIGESVEVDGIEGETVVWNQLFKAEGSPTILMLRATSTTTSTGFILTPTDYGIETSVCGFYIVNAVSEGHKVYKAANFSSNTTGLHAFANNGDNIGTQPTRCREIYTQGSNANVLFYAYGTMESTTNITIENCVCIDLTQMFGSGNEPSTVAEFESWLSAHGGIKEYYPYCAGELKDKEEGNVRGVGFNQWDEEWEEGQLNDSGGNSSNTTKGRSKNYIPVIPGSTYYFYVKALIGNTGNKFGICGYDCEKQNGYIISLNDQNKQLVIPSGVYYIRFYGSKTIFSSDVCINLSDASRNGTYVPYKSITRSVDLTTLKGKVNGAGEDVVMFPDGMKQAGSVKDEIFVEDGVVKAVKRVGTVDLGELTWVYDSTSGSYPVFYAYINSLSVNGSKLICEKYIAKNDGSNWYSFINNDQNDKIGAPSTNKPYVIIQDSSYTSASDFKTAMQGVMLNYELASPVTYVVNMQGMEMAEVKKVMVGTQKVWEKS